MPTLGLGFSEGLEAVLFSDLADLLLEPSDRSILLPQGLLTICS